MLIEAGVVTLIVLHGLVHLMGPAKAFALAELPQLTAPVSRAMGVAWLVAAVAMGATALLFALSVRSWWIVGLAAVVLSQSVIVSSWGDAKSGTLVNVILLALVLYGFLSGGPFSFAAEYRRAVSSRLADAPSSQPLLTEADLEHLPEPVRRYIRLTGSVGRPQVHHIRATWRGRIRAGPDEPWMPFTAEQVNVVDEPARFFLMDARKSGLPVDVYHAFQDGAASMRVRLLSMIPVADARGPEMTRAETVTLLNDLALLAPAALARSSPDAAPAAEGTGGGAGTRPRLRWEAIDARSARAWYSSGPHEVSAVLEFDEAGELVDFVSDDRLAASPDGRSFESWRWSTPVSHYRSFGDLRLMSRGSALWHSPGGTYAYIEMELLELETNGVR